jgi:tight adherence protein B
MGTLPLAFAVLVAGAVLLGFVGLWRLSAVEDPIEARLRAYGGAGTAVAADDGRAGERSRFGGLNRALARISMGQGLANRLTRADVPLTAAEFVLLAAMVAALLAVIGWLRVGPLFGILLGIAGMFLPLLYLNYRAGKRRQKFTNQLPDVLTLLVGALRAGYGVTQAIDMLVDRMAKPASVEFGRVMRAVRLGVPVTRALNDMADRAGSDDLYLVVTAMNVQAELGGNLAQILETITETVRERIRIKREIRTLTAQQRGTGYILAGLPIAVGFMLSMIRPGYLDPLFAPGMMRLVLILAVVMQVVGFLIIRKIVDIEV